MTGSLLLRGIEHWTRGPCSFTIGAIQAGDLVVYRHGGTVREVTRVLRNGHFWAADKSDRLQLITRPEEFRVMKQLAISVCYIRPNESIETRIDKTGETLDI